MLANLTVKNKHRTFKDSNSQDAHTKVDKIKQNFKAHLLFH